jgi:molybdate transport system substrate-binding protein
MKVLCTFALKSVMVELAPAFERRGSTRIDMAFGPTMALRKDIETGSDADAAILTDEAIDDLVRAGKAVAGTRVDLARAGIGVAVREGARKPDISTPEALKAALLAAKSVSHSRSGMSGLYFPTVLQRLGIADEMRPKIVIPDTGTMVGEVVATGRAEIGIQQISELLPVAGIDIVGPLPAPLQKITVFSASILAGAQDRTAAKALIDFVAADSRSLLVAKGLEPP